MPRLLHLADVHLGARHRDLGDAAERQRERQLAAFRRAVSLGIERRVDVALVCGDLFDSNSQPRRTVETAAAELHRLADAGIRSVVIPGTHDCYDDTSIYRAFDLRQLADIPVGSDLLTVLAAPPAPSELLLRDLDLLLWSRVSPTKRAPRSPLAGVDLRADPRATWKVGLLHSAIRIPGKVETDDVIVDVAEIAGSGLDYLALGHWHSGQEGRAGDTTWAYAGAPEPVAVDQDGAGTVLIVTLEQDAAGAKRVALERVTVGRTTHRLMDVDAAGVASQDLLVALLRKESDPDTMLDVRLVGVRTDTLALDPAEVSRALADAFLRVRVTDRSSPAPLAGELPPADTILGRFIRDLEARIERAEAAGDAADAADAREVLRLGRVLLDNPRDATLA
ncbi:MAG: DNA repair exonuclease [Chloroflexota bacterium]